MGLFRRHEEAGTVRIRCPNCGHMQNIEKHVMSVYCKQCMHRIVTPNDPDSSKPAVKPLTPKQKPQNKKTIIECPQCHTRNEVIPDALSIFCKKCNVIISLKKDAPAVKSLESKPTNGKTRTITCYTCSNTQTVSVSALSSFCSSCGNRIDLKDSEIKTDYYEKIMTRGTLHVLSSGRVHAEINVMSAKIDGEVHGNVFAEDKLAIGATGKIYGNIIARRMELEKGAFYSGNIRLNADKIRK